MNVVPPSALGCEVTVILTSDSRNSSENTSLYSTRAAMTVEPLRNCPTTMIAVGPSIIAPGAIIPLMSGPIGKNAHIHPDLAVTSRGRPGVFPPDPEGKAIIVLVGQADVLDTHFPEADIGSQLAFGGILSNFKLTGCRIGIASRYGESGFGSLFGNLLAPLILAGLPSRRGARFALSVVGEPVGLLTRFAGFYGCQSGPCGFFGHPVTGDSSAPRLASANTSVFRGTTSVYKRSPYQQNTRCGEKRSERCGDEHPHRPPNHVHLGLYVALSALLGLLGFWVCLRGFEWAGDASELVFDRKRGGWRGVLLGAGTALGGAGLSVGALMWWIA